MQNQFIMAKDKETIQKPETNRGRKSGLTEAKIDLICKALAQGKSHKDAYNIAAISYTTFYKYLKEDSEFAERVKKAEAEYQEWYSSQLVVECKRSLVELVRGYEYEETTTESIPSKDGKALITKTKVVHKRAAPNATAIIFALCNRDPEHWQNRVSNELSGKIETEAKTDVSLAQVPDELLAQVIDAINSK